MKRRRTLTFILGSLLFIAGCGGANPGGPGGPGGPSDPPPHPFQGRFVARGTGYIHTMDLTANGAWEEKISAPTSYSTPALNLADRELYVADLNMKDPMFVTVHDLDTFGQKRAFTWPQTEDMWRVHQLAVAPGGQYVAATLSASGSPFLELIEVDATTSPAGTTIHYTSQPGLVQSNLLWTDASELVFATISEGALGEGEYAAVIAVELAEFLEDDEVGVFVLRTFDRATWGLSGVSHLTLSHDGTQLAYSLNGDIWVLDLVPGAEPRQLTTGPTGNFGPTFSPDGKYVAFVGGRPYGLRDTLIVPNDGTGPYLVDLGNHDLTGAYVLDEASLVEELLAWLP